MIKPLLSLVLALLIFNCAFAQAPKGINYQGVARDNEGKPIVSQKISVRIGILKNAANGEVEYAEVHKPQTNQFGLFTLIIGQGTATTGSFAFISWAMGNKWLQIEIDPEGGSSFQLAGSQQLMSVPYAFYAEYSGNGNTFTAGQGITIVDGVISNTGDNNSTNEIQDLVLNIGTNILSLTSDATTVDLTPYKQNLTYTPATNNLSIAGGNSVTISSTLTQVLTNNANAGNIKIQDVGAPTEAADATTKGYVDNAIATAIPTNYAFKATYSFINTGATFIDAPITLTDVFDDFSVVGTTRFTVPPAGAGTYSFTVTGNSSSGSALIKLKITSGSTSFYDIKRQVAYPLVSIINYHDSIIYKLNAGDIVELVVNSAAFGENASGVLFGFKL